MSKIDYSKLANIKPSGEGEQNAKPNYEGAQNILAPTKLFSEIRARVEAATEGPWINKPHGVIQRTGCAPEDGHIVLWDDEARSKKNGEQNYAFIAASRIDIPKLLEAIDVMQSALDYIEEKNRTDPGIETCKEEYNARAARTYDKVISTRDLVRKLSEG